MVCPSKLKKRLRVGFGVSGEDGSSEEDSDSSLSRDDLQFDSEEPSAQSK
jgi:hypothetical protein